jgi:hypothetical protein
VPLLGFDESDMEQDFFAMYEVHGRLSLEVGHTSVSGWCISIYDTKGKALNECSTPDIHVQRATRTLAFADAYVQLAEHLIETRGRY